MDSPEIQDLTTNPPPLEGEVQTNETEILPPPPPPPPPLDPIELYFICHSHTDAGWA